MTDNLPNHIGFILDGNRRWAKKEVCRHYQATKKVMIILRLSQTTALSVE